MPAISIILEFGCRNLYEATAFELQAGKGDASIASADIIFTILFMELNIISCSHSSIREK